jgi:hypothetical protein
MNWGLRINIVESDYILVFVSDFALNFFGDNSAKNATFHLTHLHYPCHFIANVA